MAIENPFKIMKNVFYFTLNALFILKIFKLKVIKVNSKIYDVTAKETNNCNTHITQYGKK